MEQRNFVSSLFDWSFTNLISPRLIKFIYVLVVIFTGLGTIGFILSMFKLNAALGAVTLLIFGPLYFFLAVMWTRVLLEFMMTFFKMEQHLARMSGMPPVAAGPADYPSVPPSPPGSWPTAPPQQ